MIDVRRKRLLTVMLVSAVAIGGCRFGAAHTPGPTALARSSALGPCCEREVVHDLFDTAHREGTR